MINLHKISRIVNYIHTKTRFITAGAWSRRNSWWPRLIIAGAWSRGIVGGCLLGVVYILGVISIFWKIVVIIAQHSAYTTNCQISQLNMVKMLNVM